MIYELVKGAYSHYKRYLDEAWGQEGDARLVLPPPQRHPSPNKLVYASALGRCPLHEAKKRRKEPYVIPPTPDEELWSWHLMQQGGRDAEPLQEALLYHFGKLDIGYDISGNLVFPENDGAAVEIGVASDDLGVRGRIDALIQINGERHIIEMKRRDGGKKEGLDVGEGKTTLESMPTPKLSDAYQVLAYGLATGVENMYILTLTRFYIKLWRLVPAGSGWIIVDENGVKWDSTYNHPIHISEQSLRAEIRRHMAYLAGSTEDPEPDYLNSDQRCGTWESGSPPKKYKTTYKGKTERVEKFVPTCPYWCHGDPNQEIWAREYLYDSGVYYDIKEEEDATHAAGAASDVDGSGGALADRKPTNSTNTD